MAPPDREGAAGLGEAIVAQCSLCCGLQAQSLAPPVPAHSLPPSLHCRLCPGPPFMLVSHRDPPLPILSCPPGHLIRRLQYLRAPIGSDPPLLGMRLRWVPAPSAAP